MKEDAEDQPILSDYISPPDADETESSPDTVEAAAVVAGNGGGRISEVVDIDEARFPDSTGTVELMVTQVDYTIEGRGREEHPVIHVFGRREDGTAEHVRVLGFEPYFYVPTDSLDAPPEDEYDALIDSRETDPEGEPFESIRGEKLTKIIGRTPRDVGQIRDEFDHYEADILFPNRFLIDKGINSGVKVSERRLDDGSIQVPHTEVVPASVDTDLRVNVFDIEVDDRRGFPEDGEEPIICLTSYDSFDDEYVAWIWEAEAGDGEIPADLSDYEPYRDDLSVEVRRFESEAAMLDAFVEYIDETDPDLLTGWNFEDFDAPYLLDRLEVVDKTSDEDLSIDRLSRVNEVWRSGWGGPDIKGRVVFDLLYGYKRTQFTELDSYRLDAVGETELDVGKERYSGDIGDLWENDPTRLLEYNLRDVELCVEIDRKQNLIAFWDEVRKFVGCKLEDAPTPGDAVDQYVLHKAYGKFALPTKGKQESEEFEGGAVFDPITGVKENVTVLDLKSLYPMCMVTINAGPETKVDEDFEGETYRAPNGSRFRKQPDGIMREMVDELLTERENKKKLRNEHEPGSPEYLIFDRQQSAVKVIMNSLYGVTGWDRFRLYDKEGAAAVTATGREVIDFTETAANEIDY
ncbi:MAG: DNA polymerase domain-containing protein, partial [Halohasta sp.]